MVMEGPYGIVRHCAIVLRVETTSTHGERRGDVALRGLAPANEMGEG
jgi:hypothetical protein